MIPISPTKEQWNKGVLKNTHAQFLQSYEWGMFQQALGRTVWHLSEGDTQCLAIQYPLKGKFFYIMCPRGPIGNPDTQWWNECSQWATSLGALFLRYEPTQVGMMSSHSRKVSDIEPSTTQILDLTQRVDLLSAMHSKTRYNINLATKKGVTVEAIPFGSITEADKKEWWRLGTETAERNRISIHPQYYYETLFSTCPLVSLYKAVWNGTTVAMAVMLGCGDTMTYLFGASSHSHKEIMAPYALQWHAICDAQLQGYYYYDFWGIAPAHSLHHPLAGVTRFKAGFGGEVFAYPGTYDIPSKSLFYSLYTLMRQVKRSV